MDDFDIALAALSRISLLERLHDKIAVAMATDKPECGACQDWMKSRVCPRERNVAGYSRGPSSGDPTCTQFTIKPWIVDLKAKRVMEAIEFAHEHGLPIPGFLRLTNRGGMK